MYDIVGLGELLIDFTPIKIKGETFFKENPGGAPCNYLTIAQNLGSKTAFIGKVGNDGFGKMLKSTLEKNGVDTVGLIMSNVYNTTLAFVHLYDDGDRAFSFYRKNCADVMLNYDDINFDLLDNTKVFHFGSLSFTDDPIKSTLIKVLDYCQNKNIIISYDPNYRPTLWDSEENAVESIKIGLSYADILKLSEEEAELLTGEKDPLNACKKLNEYDIKVILVTLGDKGSFYYHKNCYGYVNGRKTKVIDTTGAGDTFFGSAVHQIIEKGIPIEDLKKSDFEEILHFSNIAASLCIENYGGIPAIPKKNEIEKLL